MSTREPATVLMILPASDYDPTESAVPWEALVAAGHQVRFATPDGQVAHADRRLTDTGFGPLSPVLMTRDEDLAAYRRMTRDASFLSPLAYDQVRVEDFDALLVPGGHAPGMKTMLESERAQALVVDFFARERPVGAICHGVLLLARSRDPRTGRSVLHGRRTTSLTRMLELSGWLMTCAWLGNYYRTYPGMTVEQEVRAALAHPDHYDAGPLLPVRDSRERVERGFVVKDGTYVSARWPGDCHRFARELVAVLASRPAGERAPGREAGAA